MQRSARRDPGSACLPTAFLSLLHSKLKIQSGTIAHIEPQMYASYVDIHSYMPLSQFFSSSGRFSAHITGRDHAGLGPHSPPRSPEAFQPQLFFQLLAQLLHLPALAAAMEARTGVCQEGRSCDRTGDILSAYPCKPILARSLISWLQMWPKRGLRSGGKFFFMSQADSAPEHIAASSFCFMQLSHISILQPIVSSHLATSCA